MSHVQYVHACVCVWFGEIGSPSTDYPSIVLPERMSTIIIDLSYVVYILTRCLVEICKLCIYVCIFFKLLTATINNVKHNHNAYIICYVCVHA